MKRKAQHILFFVTLFALTILRANIAVTIFRNPDTAHGCEEKYKRIQAATNLCLIWVEPKPVWFPFSVKFLKQIQTDELSEFATTAGRGFYKSQIDAIQITQEKDRFNHILYYPRLSPASLRTSFETPIVNTNLATYSIISELPTIVDLSLPTQLSQCFYVFMVFTDQMFCGSEVGSSVARPICTIMEREINKVKERFSRNQVGIVFVMTSDDAKKTFDNAFQKGGADKDFLYSSISLPEIQRDDLNFSETVSKIANLTRDEVDKLACQKFQQDEISAKKQLKDGVAPTLEIATPTRAASMTSSEPTSTTTTGTTEPTTHTTELTTDTTELTTDTRELTTNTTELTTGATAPATAGATSTANGATRSAQVDTTAPTTKNARMPTTVKATMPTIIGVVTATTTTPTTRTTSTSLAFQAGLSGVIGIILLLLFSFKQVKTF